MDRAEPRRSGPTHRGRIVGAVIVVALIVLVVLWDWNWFKPLVEKQASSALGRPVTLQHFDIDLGWHPKLIADGIAVANPPEFPEGSQLGSVQRLGVRVNPWVWFSNKLSLVEIEIERPVGDLGPGPSGKPNYFFEALQAKDDEPKSDKEPLLVEIRRLIIRDGDIHIVEPGLKADFRLKIKTEERKDGGEPNLRVDAKGRYAGQPIDGYFVGGSVLALRDPAQPYPVELKLRNGDTSVSLVGTVLDPMAFGGANLKLEFAGANLADLYPLTGVPLPPSPAYKLTGKFDYADDRFRFRDFKGTYGQSDIAGDAAVLPASKGGRRQVNIDAHSDKVVWSDLAGLVGGTPGEEKAPTDTPENKAEREKKEKSGKLLPDTPISLPRIRAADLDVKYRVKRIESDITPVDTLEGHLVLQDGFIEVKPLKLGVGQGSILANLQLDGRKDVVHTVADIDFRKLDFSRIVEKMSVFKGAGTVGGNARLDARGNSVAAMLGNGDGELRLFMTGGDISALLVNLAGLDFGNVLVSALGLPSRAKLNCMVADLGLEKGQVRTRTLLADTTEANVVGKGDIDLKNENIDYQIRTEPKRLNIGSLAAPINIKGPLASPSIRPEIGNLAARGGAVALLATVLGPLAALVPTIQLGLGEDNDCVALLKGIDAPAPAAAAPPAKGKKQ